MMPPEDPFQQEGNMLSGNNKNKSMLALPLPPKPKTRVEMGLVYDDPDQAPNNTTNYSCDTESSSHRSSILGCSIQPVTLKFQHVSYKTKLKRNSEWWWSCSCGGGSSNGKEKKILNDITGIVCPGEILAMLGPSGSGKTTLLTALGGRLGGKISGKILYNGQKMTRAVKRSTGFVTQDDVLYPHLTVMETLTYTAFLRLPSTLSKSEKVEQAEAVLIELGLGRCRNTIIGGPFVRGVSGGERKRVSIGQEMLINPSLLLLDEPTSGLDSTTAQRILLTLQDLARSGRTIITTIHQPSSRLYHMFNKVILLSEGSPIYYGNASSAIAYFSSIGFSPSFLVNPADFMLDLSNGIAPETKLTHLANDQGEARSEYETQKAVRQRLMSAYQSNLACKLNVEIDIIVDGHSNVSSKSTRVADTNQWTTGWFYQFSVLLARGLKERRYEAFSGLRIFQASSMSILSGLLWWNSSTARLSDQVGLLFFFSIFWGFFPLFNAIFTYPQERAMLIKERTSGMYRLSSYIMARTVGDLPMELSLPVLFTVITYWMGGLKADAAIFIETLMVVLLNVLVSQGLGLALGAVLMDVKQATTLSSVTMLTFLLAGGYYVQKIPLFISWLKYVSFSYYCYKLLVAVQYTMDETYRCTIAKFCRVADFPPIRSIGLDHKGLSVLALTIMLLSYRLIAYAALRKVTLHTK